MKTITHTSTEVVKWLKQKIGHAGTVHDHLLKEEDDFLYLPVHVSRSDAFEVANFLQNIEDQWNNQEPEHLPYLVLIPTQD